MRLVLAATVALLACGPLALHATNWPQWRGPALNGSSPDTGIPMTWDPRTNVAWSLMLPDFSGATPIVWDDTVFLNVADGGDLALWAVNRRTGKRRWTQSLGTGNRRARKQNMSSPSPVTDGNTVWAITGTGWLAAFDFTGKPLWTRDIPQDYGAFGLQWGYASSPLLMNGALYLQVLHGMLTNDPSYVFKVDGATGKTLWKVLRPTTARRESPDAYTTPLLVRTASGPEIVVTGGDVATGHDLATGKELWRAEGLNPSNHGAQRIVASPVPLGEIVIAPTRNRPMLAIRAGGRGDVTRSHRIWSNDNGPDVPTPVTDGTYLYVVRDRGVVWCLDARSGAPVYGPRRLHPGTYSGSPVLADGKVYVTSEDGLTSVFKAGPEFQLLAENPLDDYTLSSPAISEGQIFIRTAERLWAIGERRKPSRN
jgi:outer membrane protein assembly factor BamB